MKAIQLVTCLVLLCTAFFDGMRDGTIHEDWWTHKKYKWAQLYPIAIYLMIITKMSWWVWLAIPVCSWLLWQLAVRKICGKKWDSFLIESLKKIFKK